MLNIIAFIGAILIAFPSIARAVDCPPNTKSCKVVVVSEEEMNTLTAPNGIFDQATWASRSTMTDLVAAWRKKLEQSPPGEVKPADPPKAQ